MHYIEVKNVSQIYSVGNEPVNALTNISFAIEKGEFIVAYHYMKNEILKYRYFVVEKWA